MNVLLISIRPSMAHDEGSRSSPHRWACQLRLGTSCGDQPGGGADPNSVAVLARGVLLGDGGRSTRGMSGTAPGR